MPPGPATWDARGTSLAHGSPKNGCPQEDSYYTMRQIQKPGLLVCIHCAAHSRDTRWLLAGWEYKILVMASPDIHSPCPCIQTSTRMCQIFKLQGSVIGGLSCSSAERVSNARPRPAVLNGRRENYFTNLVGSFFCILASHRPTLLSQGRSPR